MNLESDTLTAHFVARRLDHKARRRRARHRIPQRRHRRRSHEMGTRAHFTFWPRFSQPKELNVDGNAVLQTKEEKSGDSRTLQTSAFRMEFSGSKEHESSKPLTAETLAAGTMEWTDSATQGGVIIPVRTQLQADKLAMTSPTRPENRKKFTPTATSAPSAGSPDTPCRLRPQPPAPRSWPKTAAGRKWICRAT